MRARHMALAMALVTGLGAGRAAAQPRTPSAPAASPSKQASPATPNDPVAKAKEQYAAAEAAMSRGDHAAAAAAYESAYQLDKDPALLFKAASAHDRAGNCQAAVAHYQRYVGESSADATLRAQASERITACQAGKPAAAGPTTTATTTAADPTATDPAAPAPDALPAGADELAGDTGAGDTGAGATGGAPSFADQDAPPSWQRSAGWLSVGVAGAFATIGTILALSAESREDDLAYLTKFRYGDTGQPGEFSGQVRERYEELVDEGKQLNLYSRLALGAAGVAAASAAVFFVLDMRAASQERASLASTRRHVAPAVFADGLGVIAGWEF